MGKRCQVCDGPVVNGRCSLCGMPYRNDEIMYHLNENRRDHYKHASWKARIMMEDDEIPYGDKPVPETPPERQSRYGTAPQIQKRSQSPAAKSDASSSAGQTHGAKNKTQSQTPGSAAKGYIQSTYKGDITKKNGKNEWISGVIIWIVIIICCLIRFLS